MAGNVLVRIGNRERNGQKCETIKQEPLEKIAAKKVEKVEKVVKVVNAPVAKVTAESQNEKLPSMRSWRFP